MMAHSYQIQPPSPARATYCAKVGKKSRPVAPTICYSIPEHAPASTPTSTHAPRSFREPHRQLAVPWPTEHAWPTIRNATSTMSARMRSCTIVHAMPRWPTMSLWVVVFRLLMSPATVLPNCHHRRAPCAWELMANPLLDIWKTMSHAATTISARMSAASSTTRTPNAISVARDCSSISGSFRAATV